MSARQDPVDSAFDLDALADVRAVLFDLDGTLYRHPPVKKRMAAELLLLPALTFSPRTTRRVWRTIRTYRGLHETIRDMGHAEVSLHDHQLDETARLTGIDPQDVREIVAEWMLQRPLAFVARAMRPELPAFLAWLAERELETGVLSDYPVDGKLNALGVRDAFSLALCSSDPEINALKPHPRGFLHACERWQLEPREVLYVGDRVEVDGAGAHAAGMPCAILSGKLQGEWIFDSLDGLRQALEARR